MVKMEQYIYDKVDELLQVYFHHIALLKVNVKTCAGAKSNAAD